MTSYADKLLQLYEFQKKIVESCERAIQTANVDKYETSKLFEEWGKDQFDPYKLTYNTHFIKNNDELIDFYKKFVDALNEAQKELYKRKLAKVEGEEKIKEEKKQKENSDKLEEEMKKSKDSLKKLEEKINKKNDDQPRSPSPEIPRPKEEPNPNLPKKEDTFDEKAKKRYVQEAERELKKHNFSDQKLNQKLGVDDWRVEMNKSVDWSTAQKFLFSIQDAIERMSKEIVCETCKETKSPILEYTALDSENKKKNFCSWECQNAYKDKNKGINQDDAKEIKKELQEIKGYLKKHNENVDKTLNNLLAWMKSGGVINITLSNDKLIVELSGKQTKIIEENELNNEQRVLKNYLQSNSEKKSINRNELEKIVGRNYNEERENKKKNGNGGIIAAIAIVGIFLAVVIGIVVHKRRKKDY